MASVWGQGCPVWWLQMCPWHFGILGSCLSPCPSVASQGWRVAHGAAETRAVLSLSPSQPCLVPPPINPDVTGVLVPSPSESCDSQGTPLHGAL